MKLPFTTSLNKWWNNNDIAVALTREYFRNIKDSQSENKLIAIVKTLTTLTTYRECNVVKQYLINYLLDKDGYIGSIENYTSLTNWRIQILKELAIANVDTRYQSMKDIEVGDNLVIKFEDIIAEPSLFTLIIKDLDHNEYKNNTTVLPEYLSKYENIFGRMQRVNYINKSWDLLDSNYITKLYYRNMIGPITRKFLYNVGYEFKSVMMNYDPNTDIEWIKDSYDIREFVTRTGTRDVFNKLHVIVNNEESVLNKTYKKQI